MQGHKLEHYLAYHHTIKHISNTVTVKSHDSRCTLWECEGGSSQNVSRSNFCYLDRPAGQLLANFSMSLVIFPEVSVKVNLAQFPLVSKVAYNTPLDLHSSDDTKASFNNCFIIHSK